ncbi:MAG: hypothetical protein Q9172_002183 [Xanthocarpia lactea]
MSYSLLIQLSVLVLSLAHFSYTAPANALLRLNKLALPQCPIQPIDSQSKPGLAAPVEQYTFTIRDEAPSIEIDLIYCPGLLINADALSRTTYRSLLAIDRRVRREGQDAPLGPPFRSPEAPGDNCVLNIQADEGKQVSLFVVINVLRFLRRWMVREQHRGSTIFALHVDDVKMATGYVRPIIDPVIAEA